MRLDKIYTRTGDRGMTSLVTGERVPKHDPRVEAFGDMDELNATIGLLRTLADQVADRPALRAEAEDALPGIQNALFDAGAILACTPERAGAVLPPFPPDASDHLEARMDALQRDLEPLRSFVLPGGSPVNAHAHLARTVCRRAERHLWRLHAAAPVPEAILVYLNRLSDYLFVFARWALLQEGRPECLWRSETAPRKEAES